MEYRLMPTELLVGAASVAILVAFSVFLMLIIEVGRAYRESLRDQYEMFKFLKSTETIFAEYYSRRLKEDA